MIFMTFGKLRSRNDPCAHAPLFPLFVSGSQIVHAVQLAPNQIGNNTVLLPPSPFLAGGSLLGGMGVPMSLDQICVAAAMSNRL